MGNDERIQPVPAMHKFSAESRKAAPNRQFERPIRIWSTRLSTGRGDKRSGPGAGRLCLSNVPCHRPGVRPLGSPDAAPPFAARRAEAGNLRGTTLDRPAAGVADRRRRTRATWPVAGGLLRRRGPGPHRPGSQPCLSPITGQVRHRGSIAGGDASPFVRLWQSADSAAKAHSTISSAKERSPAPSQSSARPIISRGEITLETVSFLERHRPSLVSFTERASPAADWCN